MTGTKYAADLDEVKLLGGDGTTTPSARTADQTEIALFWVESSPLQWNRIARTVATQPRSRSLAAGALVRPAQPGLADGYIGSFETKYLYNYWRPVTAIQNADADGNPRTSGDPTWTPLAPTPPIPDYDSAHSVQGGVAAQVLKRFFGTDHVGFETCSLTLPAGAGRHASPCFAATPASPKRRRRTGCLASSSAFTSARRSTRGSSTACKIGDRAVDRFLRPEGGHGGDDGHGGKGENGNASVG